MTLRRGGGRASRRARPLALLPTAAFLLTFGVFFVDKNAAARVVFTSERGVLTVVAIGVGYVVTALLLKRTVPWPWAPPLVLTVAVLGLAAWLVRPYYVDETAERRLVAGTVVDARPPPPGGGVPSPDAQTTTPSGPVRLSRGPLEGLGHHASGSVSVLRAPDGSLVVRFEEFDIEGVPDPVVYLVDERDARDPGGIDLGGLQGNRGSVLDYAVPPGSSGGPGWTVLVWCRAFGVPVAGATQVG